MSALFILSLSIALGSDAFAVGLSLGMAGPPQRERFKIAAGFGLFQFLFPLIGIAIGDAMRSVSGGPFVRWLGVSVLVLVAIRFFKASFSPEGGSSLRGESRVGLVRLIALSASVSIDALSVGLSMGIFASGAVVPALVIGAVTFLMSLFALEAGKRLGQRLGDLAEFAGGLILLAVAGRMAFL